jgi:uncharacterized protein (TIGR02231 family)
MTLSTATPSMVATAPELEPLAIVLAAGQPEEESGGSYASQKGAITQQRRQIEMTRNNGFNNSINSNITDGAVSQSANAAPGNFGSNFAIGSGGGGGANQPAQMADNGSYQVDSDLNDVAGKLQVLELVAKDAGSQEEKGLANSDQEGVSVTYQLPARTSLPSRADQQTIQIATLDMTGDFYKLAMPVLTSYVYDQATVTNQTRIVLLAGQVASYFNDEYVGSGSVPTVAVGEQFTLGFGIDSSLRATRELVEKTEAIQGGNRALNFNYRLAVENFGSVPETVRLVDRLPTSKNQDVKFTIVSNTRPPSTQPIGPTSAGSAARHAGILNWSIDVPAQAMGEQAATVDYEYKLEFDKQLSIGGLPSTK